MISNNFAVLLVLATATISSAFTTFNLKSHNDASTQLKVASSNEVGRRQFFAGVAVTSVTFLIGQRPSFADVSDGNILPAGAAEFSRVVKMKEKWIAVGKRVKSADSKIDEKEWDNILRDLRGVYNAGDDMKGVAKGMSDPSKKKRGNEIVATLRNQAQAGEAPIQKKDLDAFLAVHKKTTALIDEFFDLLSDVPDEI